MPLDTLIDYFNNNGWPLDVNEQKLHDRASISDEQRETGRSIVKIERHRAILVSSYSKGLPMSAFRTYWMQYAVNPITKEVEELSEEDGDITIDDMDFYVDEEFLYTYNLSINRLEDGNYRICEGVCKEAMVIATFEEAIIFGLEFVSGAGVAFKEMIAQEESSLSNEQLKKLCDEYTETLRKKMINTIENLWKERDFE